MSIWILALLASPAVAQTPAQTTLLTANRTVPIQAGICSVETRAMFLGACPDRPDCPDILLWPFIWHCTDCAEICWCRASRTQQDKLYLFHPAMKTRNLLEIQVNIPWPKTDLFFGSERPRPQQDVSRTCHVAMLLTAVACGGFMWFWCEWRGLISWEIGHQFLQGAGQVQEPRDCCSNVSSASFDTHKLCLLANLLDVLKPWCNFHES